jgi:dihydrofolate reductase
MGGGQLVRSCLDAGLLDELHLHLSPVLLGGGAPLFAPGGPAGRQLEQYHVRVSAVATHLSYRVVG